MSPGVMSANGLRQRGWHLLETTVVFLAGVKDLSSVVVRDNPKM